MSKIRQFLFFSLLLLSICSCKNGSDKSPELNSMAIRRVIGEMTDLMIHDVTNPPLAGRFYSYALLSGYEVVSQNDSACISMKGILNDYPDIVKPVNPGNYNYQVSAILAMIATAKKMQPSGSLLEKYEQRFIDSCLTLGFSDEVIESSKTYALQISKQILAYAKADRYNRISNYIRYTPSNKEGSWYPTPPGYFTPVEPYFNTVRPFMLDTCNQFKPVPPVPFSKDKNSTFFKMMTGVYVEGGTGLTVEHRAIAAFWDCNPFALRNEGHLLVGMKKISPGAHWMGITGIACSKSKVKFSKAMEINTVVAVGLMDSFISCWDEKFRSNRIRPETAIRIYIDPNWKPLLQTPPFPEYLSGHSSISSTSAFILTHYFGGNYHYKDDVEVKYGLPARSFTSFKQAADQAAISRYWGGIHFMDAVENGKIQGFQVGEWIVNKFVKKRSKANSRVI
ncbi:MAG: vanadium-dependent haloperoxidase [Phormidesmis sp. FL-bin-119]|nr:vanadium-dependent haloperoxidase [Pedobacter sp.]